MKNVYNFLHRLIVLNRTYLLPSFIFLCILVLSDNTYAFTYYPPVAATKLVETDTLPKENFQSNFRYNKSYYPYDITPKNVVRDVTYDAKSGKYILTEKIGDQYYRLPTYMTTDEYMAYKAQEQEMAYFQNLNGIQDPTKRNFATKVGKFDPMSKLDLGKSITNRLFGGLDYNIKPRGSVDLTLGFFDYQNRKDPSLPRDQQRQLFIPGEFNMRPRLSIDGGIGEKMKINFNYDNQSSFNFDRQIKLKYDSQAFSEDDILKKIEAGNVSLPLKNSLIPGIQNLFGLRTDLQFGHLKLSLIAAQQQSRRSNFQIQNGSSAQDIEVRPDEYDENRHFFISHYNRATYERTLANLPQINTSFRVAQIEVWISDDRADYQQGSTMIAAISDLGEGDLTKYTSRISPIYNPINPLPSYLLDITGLPLPDNRANAIYSSLVQDPTVNELDKTSTALAQQYRFKQNRDFEVFRGRMLNQSEYTFNQQLGTLSLNIRLRPNQVLSVAYKYYYTARCDTVYTVGQVATEGLESSLSTNSIGQQEVTAPKVIFTKLLKSANQNTDNASWDLMMKNVYNLQTSQLSKEGFNFDIFYEDDFADGALKKFIPEESVKNIPLLQLFGVDRLNRFGDPQPDGVFDYVPGVTIIERTGSVVFPVLEPFGNTLDSLFQDPALSQKYTYRQLYDTTITIARQSLELNKFVMKARVKAASNGEYNLGGLFIQKGSVNVTAGGVLLVEGQDYEIDYGIGRLRVINPSYLSQGTPINIQFEDNAIFGLQQKNMLGMRAEYDFGKKLTIGGTAMKLWDRPFTQKVNIGDDPINNKMYGIDVSYSDETPWLTKALDKLPFYSTNAASSINFFGEAAIMQPGYSSAIKLNNDENESVVSLDDFEGAINGLTLGGFNTNVWALSSTPSEFKEQVFADSLLNGANRAKITWYQIDRSSGSRRNQIDRTNSYTRIVDQTELFNREVQLGQTELFTFDIGYFPTERGPYNFDKPGGYPGFTDGVSFDAVKQQFTLNKPETRWGGIMRYFQNTDFEASNYEFIDFWVLNPFMDRPDGIEHVNGETGEILFQIGNISEDIIHDNLQFYENGIPSEDTPNAMANIKETRLGRVPINVPIANGFDRVNGKQQDVGYDGLNDDQERLKFKNYIDEMVAFAGSPVRNLIDDPAGDNFRYFGDLSFPESEPLITRMKDFNGPDGNAPLTNSDLDQSQLRGNRFPESEDLNNNRSLDQGESYYTYTLKVKNLDGKVDSVAAGQYYKQMRRVVNTSGVEEIWYRFQIPLTSGEARNISGFRAIQFMRMYFTKFSSAKTFRFADFQLVRSSWRRSPPLCPGSDFPTQNIKFSVDEVGVEENSTKLPFNYVTPRGIQQERIFGTLTNLLQDEKSMSLNFCDLFKGCQVGVNKLQKLNLTQYKKLQLFVHAEGKSDNPIPDGKLALFVKVGKDLINNFYEYEIPLRTSNIAYANNKDSIWLSDNFVDIDIEKFKDVKKAKLKDGILEIDDPDKPGAKIRIKGIPSLGLVKVLEIGVRNLDETTTYCGEVWINELRAVGLSEDGGIAAQGRLQARLADLGEVNVTGSMNTIGFGGIDQRLQERAQQEVYQYNLATNINVGKLLPKFLPLNLPMYAQYSKSTINPLFDPYQLDLSVKEVADLTPDATEKEAVYERAAQVSTIKSINFTNVRVEGTPTGNKPWNPQNITASYSFNEAENKDPIIASDKTTETQVSLDYNYSSKGLSVQPLKFITSKYLKLLSEFNFNLLPSRFTFNTGMNRFKNSRKFRQPITPVFQFDDRRFRWDRNYALDWDLTKAVRFTFNANSSAIVDELRQTGIANTAEDRNWVNESGEDYTQQVRQNPDLINQYRNQNLGDLGRTKNYKHNVGLTYARLPFHLIPLMDWVQVSADYKADYNWTAGALIFIDELNNRPGNIIQNTQSRSLNGTFSFDKLYAKWGYLKRIEAENAGAGAVRSRTRTRPTGGADDKTAAKPEDKKERTKSDGPRTPSLIEKILIRPLLSLRSAKFTYREDFGTLIPGFNPQASLLGLSSNMEPGLGFISGFQPNLTKGDNTNFLLSNQSSFNSSPNFNDQIAQNERQAVTARITLEPIRSFIVDIDFTKNYRKDHTEVFKAKESQFMQLARYDIGSFDYSYFGVNSFFEGSKDVYARFKAYKVQVSNDLINQAPPVSHPDYPDYAQGYGPTSYAVNVPAFLAAYTGKAPTEVSKNLQNDVKGLGFLPKPNWNLRYDGLSKAPFFSNFLQSFTLRHGYKSTLSVSKFNTAPDYIESNPFLTNISNNNYYSQIEIPALTVQEAFSPLLGIQMKTKSNLSLNLEYKKTRNLDLRLNANELAETKSSEITIGMGYSVLNFKGFQRSTKRKKKAPVDTGNGARNTPLETIKNRTLTANVDFSIRDDRSDIYRLENDNDPQAQRGQKTILLKPSVEYQMYKNLSIRLFADYQNNIPYVFNQPPIVRFQAGSTVRFLFN